MFRQSRAPTILLTRPLPQSQRFAAQLRARWPEAGVLISPLMAADYRLPQWPQRDFTALILASETGAEAARRISATGHSLPRQVYCVGERTAAAALAAGFQPRRVGGDADALVKVILEDQPPGPLLFLRGQDSTGEVETRLISAGIETVSAIAYAQIQQPLSVEAQSLLQHAAPVILPVFSPRSARLLIAQCLANPPQAPLWVAALSPAVAQAATELSPWHLQIATRPDAEAMLNAIAALPIGGIGS